ncbi:transcription initiation factor TFIID subunit 8-like [Coffea arabica]|uniref:Transcription initiation factor TFIID subunit 8-like n=1 Tax=Coffea arabica TaxID=13443 RepID=A0A6P6T8Z9_COFAR|nr:transcription initiation factor TFIID subunit 8-like [Coffea arabica]
MSDGGGENVKEGENNLNHLHSKKSRSRADDFGLSIAKVAVAQICEAAGFQGFQRTALDTLSDVAVRHILEIGKTGNMFANLAGRSQSNVFDIIQGLEDLGSIQGFSGASDVDHCLLGSGTVREMVRYVGEAEEIPFAYSLPGFPVLKEREPGRTFEQTGGSPPAEHIPPWLPVFPDPETYVSLHKIDEKMAQIWEDEVGGPVEKRRELDKTFANLQQRMACNGTQPSVEVDFGNEAKEKGLVECNPFLTPPLQHGEKEVSLVLPPAKLSDEVFLQSANLEVPVSHISAMETFAPGIEAVKSGTFDFEDGRKKVPLNGRPNVRFKLGGGKRCLRVAISSQNQGIDKNSTWFRNDDGMDDKKRRVEQILKPSYESAGTDSLVN